MALVQKRGLSRSKPSLIIGNRTRAAVWLISVGFWPVASVIIGF